MNLFKSPDSSNRKTGNVSLSYEEYEDLKAGAYDHILALGCALPVKDWMIDNAKDMDGYVLVPIFKSSFLIKGAK